MASPDRPDAHGGAESTDEDREAILARRRQLVAAALAGLAFAGNACGGSQPSEPEPTTPEPLPAPTQPAGDAGVPPQPCLSIVRSDTPIWIAVGIGVAIAAGVAVGVVVATDEK